MRTRLHVSMWVSALALCGMWSAAARAERQPGWDFGADVIYQFSQDIGFQGGSKVSMDDDIGIALTFGYRLNPRLELQFSLDWNSIHYKANVAPAVEGGLGFSTNGDLEAFTPRVGLAFNLLQGDMTPYVNASVGWSWIDTNIPNGPPVSSCWWDPWFGYVCGTWQSTRSFDDFVYHLGAGVRWDVTPTISMRLGYEKHWIDISQANGTPNFDQIKLGIMARY